MDKLTEIEVFEKNRQKSEKTFSQLFPDLYNNILNMTSFLDIEDQNWSMRKYCYSNNIKEYPKCVVCGNKCKIDRKCCSVECTKIYCKSDECISKKIQKAKEKHGEDCYKRKMSNFDILKKNDIDLYNDIFDKTKWMKEDTSYSERMYCYHNNINEYPKCAVCGNDTKFIQSYGYTKTCCGKCNSIYNSRIKLNFSDEKKKDIKERTSQTRLNFSDEKKKDIKERTSQTRLNFSDEKKKDILNKMKLTCTKRHGVDNIFKKKEYIKECIKNKYDVNNPSNLKWVRKKISEKQKIIQNLPKTREKIKQTNLERYGVEHYAQSDEYKNKSKQTNLERYGVLNHKQLHYNEETRNALSSGDNLREYIKLHNIKSNPELSKSLNIQECTSLQYLKKYNIQGLINRNISHYEDEITSWLNEFNINITNNKRIINNKEIDIFLPDYNIGIEFNGNYWHSDIFRDKRYHQQKSTEAKNNDIFLYHIFEYEWKNNKEKIKKHLANILNLNKNKIYARKCIIGEIEDNKIKKEFLNKNHLQGDDKSTIKIGLYYDNQLVEIMTFCKPRFNNNYQYELSRLCTVSGCNVIGGADKLFKYFLKTYNPKSIISYSNFAKNVGSIYNKLGFDYINLTDPNYVWCKNDIVLSRYQTQKSKLLKDGFVGNTEDEIMKSQGFFKIYDCGNHVYGWIYKD